MVVVNHWINKTVSYHHLKSYDPHKSLERMILFLVLISFSEDTSWSLFVVLFLALNSRYESALQQQDAMMS